VIINLQVIKATRVMPFPPAVGNDKLQLNLRGLTLVQVMLMCKQVKVSAMQMRVRRKVYCKPMIN